MQRNYASILLSNVLNIIRKNKAVILTLTISLFMLLNTMNYAYAKDTSDTIDVKSFGAVGDGITDDTAAIKKALASEYRYITINPGQYKVTDNLVVTDKVISAYKATIYTDNTFVGTLTHSGNKQSLILIRNGINETEISGLTVESRETKEIRCKGDIDIRDCSNVIIQDCNFLNETNMGIAYDSNIDLYSGWDNITIKNNKMTLNTNASSGGCIWVRNFYNEEDCSNLLIEDNTCIKNSHDEIVAIFHGEMSNIIICNNDFTTKSGTKSSSPYAFSIGSSSANLKNVSFINNTANVEYTLALFKLHGDAGITKDQVYINDNTFICNISGIDKVTSLFYATANQSISDMTICKNDITINTASESEACRVVYMGSYTGEVLFENNNIKADRISNLTYGNRILAKGNTVDVKTYISNAVFKETTYIVDNKIVCGTLDGTFSQIQSDVDKDIVISGNTFTANNTSKTDGFIMCINNKLNNHSFQVDNNTFVITKLLAGKRLFHIQLKDATVQVLIDKNNKITNMPSKYYDDYTKSNLLIKNS